MREIIAEWRKLPAGLRATEKDAALFAQAAVRNYRFQDGSPDPSQTVKAWLMSDLPKKALPQSRCWEGL